MKIKATLLGSTIGLAMLLSGMACGPSGDKSGSADALKPGNTKVGDSKAVAATAPQAPTGTSLKGDLEVQAFQGGYGIDFYQTAGKELQVKNPSLKMKVEGNPRIWEQLRPRLVGGTPPDLMLPGWGMDHWALVAEGQVLALDDAINSPAYDGKTPWKDTFEPSMLALGQQDGHQYVLPFYFSMMGWWFDPNVFAKNGWTVPKTYDDLLTLGEKIKAKGMAPITFQGKYPYYMIDGMLLPWLVSIGGPDALKAAQNLEPGAWKSAAMVQSAKMIDDLNKKGFFEKGAVALSHTESQQEFLQGKAAMIPCGTWLYSEMKNVMPPTAKMEYMRPPVVKDGKGDALTVQIGIEPWMVPKDAKNPDGAVAFYKYMTSLPKAKQFVEAKGTLTAIKGSSETKLPESLVVPAKMFKESKAIWAVQYRQWYPAFDKEIQNALTSMLNGELTPEAFCDRVEVAAEKTRKDDSIPKHKVAG